MLVDSIGQTSTLLSFHGQIPFHSVRQKRPRRCFQRGQRNRYSVHAEGPAEVFTTSESTATAVDEAVREGRSSLDSQVDSLTSQAQTAGNAVKDLSDSAQDTRSSGLGSGFQEASQRVSEASDAGSQAAQQAALAEDPTPLSDGGQALLDGFQNAFDDVNKSVSDAVTSLRDSVNSSISGGQQSFSGGSEEISRQVQDLRTDLARQFEDGTGEAGREISKQLSGISDAAGSALQDASAGLESLGGQALQSVNSALDTLPEPLRLTIERLVAPIGQALEVPTIRNSALSVAIGYSAYLWFTARFGGFAGRVSPQEALKLLETEDAVLLDVRADMTRDSSGIPELRFGARNKGVALPLVRVRQKAGTQAVKAEVLSYQVGAILVGGLAKVSSRSRIIVLSDSETQGVKLARAIASEIKLKAYLLKGGFSGWTAAGLPVRQDTEYESGAIAGLNDTVEGSILPFIRDPLTLIGVAFFGLGLSAVLIDEHKTLQFIGAFGIVFTLGTIPIRYNSLQAARDDILGPYIRLANFVLGLIPKGSPTVQSSGSPSPTISATSSSGSTSSSPSSSSPPSSSTAATPVSNPNGQKASTSATTDSDDEYGEIFRELKAEGALQKTPDVSPKASKPDTEGSKSLPDSGPSKASSKSSPP